MSWTVRELARHVQGEVVGDDSLQIHEVRSIDRARAGSVVFADSAATFAKAEASDASCIIATKSERSTRKAVIGVDRPRSAFAKVLALYHPPKIPHPGIHPSTVLGDQVRLGSEVSIGPFVVVGDRVAIGDRVVIGAGCVIGDDCVIGEASVLWPRVTLYERVVTGRRVIIHAGAVIGADGFGYVREGDRHVKVPQVGTVVIEDDVEVGANVCVDRATLDETIVRRGVKIDNLVQIAHNVTIGEDSLIVAQAGISGSARLGRECVLGGQVGVGDHVILGDRVMVGPQAGIPSGKVIATDQVVLGSPARPLEKARRQLAALGRLPDLLATVAELRKAVAELRDRGTRGET